MKEFSLGEDDREYAKLVSQVRSEYTDKMLEINRRYREMTEKVAEAKRKVRQIMPIQVKYDLVKNSRELKEKLIEEAIDLEEEIVSKIISKLPEINLSKDPDDVAEVLTMHINRLRENAEPPFWVEK